jgi:hypothetical protein
MLVPLAVSRARAMMDEWNRKMDATLFHRSRRTESVYF